MNYFIIQRKQANGEKPKKIKMFRIFDIARLITQSIVLIIHFITLLTINSHLYSFTQLKEPVLVHFYQSPISFSYEIECMLLWNFTTEQSKFIFETSMSKNINLVYFHCFIDRSSALFMKLMTAKRDPAEIVFNH